MEQDVCRICAEKHYLDKSIKIFLKTNLKTLQQIKQITGIMLKNEKNMPSQMCDDCQMRLKLAFDFRETCLRSQKLLRQAAKGKNINIKSRNKQQHFDAFNCLSDNENDKPTSVDLDIKCSPTSRLENDEDHLSLCLLDTTNTLEADQKPIELKQNLNNVIALQSSCSEVVVDDHEKKPNIFELEPEIDLGVCPDYGDYDEKPIPFDLEEIEAEGNTNIVNIVVTPPPPLVVHYDEDKDISVIVSSSESNGSEDSEDCMHTDTEAKTSTVKRRRPERKTTSRKSKADRKEKQKKRNKSIPASEKETKYICYLCGEKFYCLTYYTHHMNRHKGEKTFVCDQCPQSFYTQQMLKRHSYRHTGVRPYACSFCSQTFIDKYAKLRHEQAHQNLRPYKCSECEKAFNTNDTLKRHMLTHTGIREFSCTLCQRSFLQKKHLITHYRSMFHKQNEEKASANVQPQQPQQTPQQ